MFPHPPTHPPPFRCRPVSLKGTGFSFSVAPGVWGKVARFTGVDRSGVQVVFWGFLKGQGRPTAQEASQKSVFQPLLLSKRPEASRRCQRRHAKRHDDAIKTLRGGCKDDKTSAQGSNFSVNARERQDSRDREALSGTRTSAVVRGTHGTETFSLPAVNGDAVLFPLLRSSSSAFSPTLFAVRLWCTGLCSD